MKKILLILIALPLLCLCACGDDETPDVDFTVKYDNAVVSGGNVYVVKGDTLVIDSIGVKSANSNKIAAIVGSVNYYFNGLPIARKIVPPYRLRIPTDSLQEGRYSLSFVTDVAVVGYSLATAAAQTEVNVVGSAADLPSDTVAGDQITIIRN